MKETEIKRNIYKVSKKADVDSLLLFWYVAVENEQCVEIWGQHIKLSSWIQELGSARSVFASLGKVLGTKNISGNFFVTKMNDRILILFSFFLPFNFILVFFFFKIDILNGRIDNRKLKITFIFRAA